MHLRWGTFFCTFDTNEACLTCLLKHATMFLSLIKNVVVRTLAMSGAASTAEVLLLKKVALAPLQMLPNDTKPFA